MNWAVIQQALETTISGLNLGLPIAWENVKFDPRPGTAFLRVLHQPLETEKLNVGSTGVMMTSGLMVLGLNYPAGIGSGVALAKADTIAASFKPGTSFAAGSGDLVVRRTSLEAQERSSQPDWWVVPIIVHYDAYHNY